MDLHPWGSGTWRHPEAGTEEIVATLESVIRREPNHMGAGSLLHSCGGSIAFARTCTGRSQIA